MALGVRKGRATYFASRSAALGRVGPGAVTATFFVAITATVVQTRVGGVNGDKPGPDIRKNLDYFLECIDIAQGFGGPSDLLLFHEFPIMGFSRWTKEQHYDIAIEVPGPEIEAVKKKASPAQLLYRLRHLRQRPGELEGSHPAPDGDGGARRQGRYALEATQCARHVPGL